MSVNVKICGVTSVSDGLAAAAAGADMIGLMFYERSPRHLPLATATEIARALPPHVVKVGVFVNPSVEAVQRAIAECGVSLLQFHGDEPPEFCTQFGVMSLKAFRIRDAASLAALTGLSDRRLVARRFFPRRARRNGREIQLGACLGGKEAGASDFPGRAG